jgi:arabinose-5-phosphate isomerase
MNHIGENVVRIEAQALSDLADRIAGPMADAFNRGVELLYCCPGRVVVTGMGKSGLIARKVAATLSSTGTPALFMHPVEALHGDLGMLAHGDVIVALSASGETDEILQLLATIKRLRLPLIAVTCDRIEPDSRKKMGTRQSTLAASAEVFLSCAVAEEGCTMGLAPTASTTAMLALGDALAVAVAEKKGFKEEDFARLHPGGKLGKRLARVETLMYKGEAVPRVSPKTKMPDVIYEMSRKKLGVTAVVEDQRLVGIISDGDLRRLLELKGKDVLDMCAEECMTRDPKTVSGEEFAATALAIMEERKITSLVVVSEGMKLEGIVHLHDLWGTEMV